MRLYFIEGDDAKACRFVKREGKEVKVCRKADSDFLAHSVEGYVCLRDNVDRLYDALQLPKK